MPSSDVVEVLKDWPQPGTGNTGPRICTGECPLVIAYPLPSERIAVIEFPVYLWMVYGLPNDETLQSHPLYAKGLKFYSVHRISNSSRLAAIEAANAVHPRHDADAFPKDKEHYVFTFQDSTLECIVVSGERFKPKISVFAKWVEANVVLVQSGA